MIRYNNFTNNRQIQHKHKYELFESPSINVFSRTTTAVRQYSMTVIPKIIALFDETTRVKREELVQKCITLVLVYIVKVNVNEKRLCWCCLWGAAGQRRPKATAKTARTADGHSTILKFSILGRLWPAAQPSTGFAVCSFVILFFFSAIHAARKCCVCEKKLALDGGTLGFLGRRLHNNK